MISNNRYNQNLVVYIPVFIVYCLFA